MSHAVADASAAVSPDAVWGRSDPSDRSAVLAEILARVSSEALQGETLDAVLQRIVDCLAKRLPVAIASIILLDDERTHFVKEVWAGTIDLDPRMPPWPVSIGAAGRCAQTGAAQLIADVASDPDYVPGHHAVRSEYLVPIWHRTRLHGVLNLESTRSDFFAPEVCMMFDAVAAQVAGAVHLARVVDELEIANRRLEQLSMSDGLTGIANRRCFDQRLAEAWRCHAAGQRPLGLLLVDVDFFKSLNDARGHLHGDECLRLLSGVCGEFAAAHGGLVARYGGEEFALLLPDCDVHEARRRAERLRECVQALALPHLQSAVAACLTVSIGASSLVPDEALVSDALIDAADRALYAAKAGGRNRVVARAVGIDTRSD